MTNSTTTSGENRSIHASLQDYNSNPDKVERAVREANYASVEDALVRGNMDNYIKWLTCNIRQKRKLAILNNQESILSFCKLLKVITPSKLTAALRSTVLELIRFMYKHMGNDSREIEIIIEVHDSFMRVLDLSTIECETLIVFACQLKLLSNLNLEKTMPLVHYLVVENYDKLGVKILDIQFLPEYDLESYSAINAAFTRAKDTFHNDADQIDRILRYSNMAVSVEEHLLQFILIGMMHLFIASNISDAFKDGQVAPWAFHVINKLLTVVKSSPDVIQREVGKCLGLFGAIDPSRFADMPSSAEVQDAKFTIPDISRDDFQEKLLRALASKTILPDDPAVATFQCALKYVFRALNLSEKDRPFINLPDDLKECVRAAQVSTYESLSFYADGQERNTLPFFKTTQPYANWVRIWANEMTKDFKAGTTAGGLFAGLRRVLFDLQFTEEILPVLVYNYLLDENIDDDRKKQMITGEIRAVISSSVPESISTFDCSSAVESHVSVTSLVLNQAQLMASQRIFCLFDALTAWFSVFEKSSRDKVFQILFGSVDKCLMAQLAYGCKAYARSLKYCEEYIHHSGNQISPACSKLLQQIYLALDDPDGAIGSRLPQSFCDLNQEILTHEANNANEDALTCCTRAIEAFPDSLEFHKKLIRCQMSLDHLSDAMNGSRYLLTTKPEWKSKITPYMATCAWQLGRWNDLDSVITGSGKEADNMGMSFNISRLLNCIITKDASRYSALLNPTMVKAMRPITVAVSEKLPYEQCYPHLVRIQELNEIRMAASVLLDFHPEVDFGDFDPHSLWQFWQRRNAVLQPNLKVLGTVLTLQRTLLSLNESHSKNFSVEIAKTWLLQAKLARKLGHKQRGYSCLLKVNEMIPKVSKDLQFVATYITEKAKFFWSRGDDDSRKSAIEVLEHGVRDFFGPIVEVAHRKDSSKRAAPPEHQAAYFKILLFKTKLYEESGLLSTPNIIAMYTKLMDSVQRSEKGALQLAKLYDKLCVYDKQAGFNCDHMKQAIIYYKKTLTFGSKYIYEALPRLLQIWFDLGSVFTHYERLRSNRGTNAKRSADYLSGFSDIKEAFDQATRQVDQLKTSVNSSVLYTALSQMLARTDHSNKKVQDTLRSLVVTILKRHPKQVSWSLFSNLLNDSSPQLVKACNNIINEAFKTNSDLKFFNTMKRAAELFKRLIDTKVDKVRRTSLTELKLEALVLFFKQNPNIILMPAHKFLRPSILPENPSGSASPTFPDAVTIHSICNEITIFSSLAKPKKFILRGSDGKNYSFLAKPDDDLRRDSRVIEFLELFNRLMLKDPETRKRQLKIVVFAVIPFGEKSGLIEFVEGLTDVRSLIMEGYYENMQKNRLAYSAWQKELKDKHPGKTQISDEAAANRFKGYIAKNCQPPVFWQWFAKTYTNPTEWHAAKLTYSRSLAVMSIVGYIIGLGDRHLENILIEVATGRIVHVDFNCIFNRGETLDTPERVPFRLTHNLIDAMGATCFQGHFQRTCEEVLRLARSNAAPIMSLVRAFAFDPLVGAGVQITKTQQHAGRLSRGGAECAKAEDLTYTGKFSVADIVEKLEICNEEASKSIKLIDERLRGLHRPCLSSEMDSRIRPLSVKGHVDALIEEATNDVNLARMFFGWAPYL